MQSSGVTTTVSAEMIKPYNGEGDFMMWLQKVKLVAKLNRIPDLAVFLPLYLEGDAMAVYMELADDEQAEATTVVNRLTEAFTDSAFVAFAKLTQKRWIGEQVDVYANELSRLASLAGFKEQALEKIVKLRFVNGLPSNISCKLQQISGILDHPWSEILSRARVLTANKSDDVGAVAASLRAEETKQTGKLYQPTGFVRRCERVFNGQCYRCGGPHMIRFCKERLEIEIPRKYSEIKLKCYNCGKAGHIAARCTIKESSQGKLKKGGCCASSHLDHVVMRQSLPVIDVEVNKQTVKALVDTGCGTTLVDASLVEQCYGVSYVTAFNNVRVKCRGKQRVQLTVRGVRVTVDAIVTENILSGIQVVLGMDVINRLGGVSVVNGVVEFVKKIESCNLVVDSPKQEVTDYMNKALVVEDKDFIAEFDGSEWMIKWKWKSTERPILKNKISCYDRGLEGNKQRGFEEEVERWITEGILMPWKENVSTGVIPLMAVEQATKNKVRPVLDFRELNQYVSCHTGDEVTDICTETLRTWRQTTGAASIVDLKAAYLQLRVSPDLWKYQLVNYKGKTYCLTRLGFGLNCAPRIMAKVLKTVLKQSQKIASATASYIDDILVDEEKATAREVRAHLQRYGLVTKSPEPLDGGSALGLKLKRDDRGELIFTRGNQVPEEVKCRLSRRELFSVCGKLVGHYPVAGWLRVACSFIKRMAEGSAWEDYIGDETIGMLQDVLERVRREDPVKGKWFVSAKARKGVVWCDASSLALGVVLCVNDNVVEDGAWLRKTDDFNHINVAELEAAMRALNMAVKWGLNDIEIKTDSATVAGWLKIVLSEERKIQTRGASEMIIKRRLGTFKNLVAEFGIKVDVTLVPTTKNKADILTRVKKEWMNAQRKIEQSSHVSAVATEELRAMHDMHHMGVDRTLFLARQVTPDVNKDEVKRIVQSCQRCQSIDPAPSVHEKGKLSVEESWRRIAIDITHYRQIAYMSVVDCGPGRFAIWRELRNEGAEFVAGVLNEIFLERGAVEEVLMDNATIFHSQVFKDLLDRWKVSALFRAAYRPSGNGIVERHHRTIKAMAERAGITPMEAVYWYNITPRHGIDARSVPHLSVNNYIWRGFHSNLIERDAEISEVVKIGDEVWVKPPNVRCTTPWEKGIVTGVNSKNNVEVNGTPRHILDVRRVMQPLESVHVDSNEHKEMLTGDEEVDEDVDQGDVDKERRYPLRERRPPIRFDSYYPQNIEAERGVSSY